MPELRDAQDRRLEIEEKKRKEKLENKFKDAQKIENEITSTLEKYSDSVNKAEIIIDGKIQSLFIGLIDSDKRKHKTVLLSSKDYKALFSKINSTESAIIKNYIFEYIDKHQNIKQLYEKKYHAKYGWAFIANKIYLNVIW
jgi:TnpA family transposase